MPEQTTEAPEQVEMTQDQFVIEMLKGQNAALNEENARLRFALMTMQQQQGDAHEGL